MTKRETQKRLVDLSIITVSALVMSGTYLLATRLDAVRFASKSTQSAPLVVAPKPATLLPQPPVAGLVPAPAQRRRIIVVRRSRAS